MLAMAAGGRGWTAWSSAPDWPGMTHDALFQRINQVVSALWGGIFIASGVAVLLCAGHGDGRSGRLRTGRGAGHDGRGRSS